MIKRLSTIAAKYLGDKNDSLREKDILKIKYTLEVILGDLIKFIIIFLMFIFLKEISLFLLAFIILISTRPLGGGIHCKIFSSCLIFSILYFLIVVLGSSFFPKLNINFYIIFFMVSFIITMALAPCHNEKRPIKNRATLKILSLISLTFWSILYFNISNVLIGNCIFISILLQIIQVIIVSIKGVVVNAKIYKLFFSHIA